VTLHETLTNGIGMNRQCYDSYHTYNYVKVMYTRKKCSIIKCHVHQIKPTRHACSQHLPYSEKRTRILTSVQKVSFEGRNLAYNVPRLLLECAYPIQDASTVLSGQRARVRLCLRPFLPASSRRPGRTRGLHELLFVAGKRIALAVLVPVDAHALAAWRGQRPDGRAAAHLALERSRPHLRRWAGAGGRDGRAGTNICGWRARPFAELMLRGARLGYLRVRLGRTGRHVLARLGNV